MRVRISLENYQENLFVTISSNTASCNFNWNCNLLYISRSQCIINLLKHNNSIKVYFTIQYLHLYIPTKMKYLLKQCLIKHNNYVWIYNTLLSCLSTFSHCLKWYWTSDWFLTNQKTNSSFRDFRDRTVSWFFCLKL